MTDTERELRDGLERVLNHFRGWTMNEATKAVLNSTRVLLDATAPEPPKHPVAIAAERWAEGHTGLYRSVARRSYLFGYKAGMLACVDIADGSVTRMHIKDEADRVPTGLRVQ